MRNDGKVTLYQYWRSSSSWRVRWALAIKDIAFDSVAVNLLDNEQRADAHDARNPARYVPALAIDGRVLAESVAILEYLDETRPTPALYPRDAWLRARVRQVVETVNSGIQPLQNLSVLQRHAEGDAAAQKQWAAYFNDRGMHVLERLLCEIDAETGRAGTFAVGDAISAADLFIVPQVYSARRFGVDVAKYPRVLAAERAALATEHASAALPENQPGAPVK
jgi:maleylacetoacetate isomerase